MASLLLDQIKKQTSSFLHEKINSARMVFTDVTPAELLAEEATNNDPCSPDARTMTRIAEASFEIDDYWRIVDVLHRRLYSIDWKQWRQSYKALVLLDFLLTHGPEELAEEFLCDTDIIQELSAFTYKDEKGFDWGASMMKKSERILELLRGGDTLKQARLQALKITNEIQGFGNTMVSPPPPPSSSSPSSSRTSQSSSFGSYSTSSSFSWNDVDGLNKYYTSKEEGVIESYLEGGVEKDKTNIPSKKNFHIWDSCAPIQEKGSLLNSEEVEVEVEEENEDDFKRPCGFFSGIRSRFGGNSPLGRNNVFFTSLSDVGNVEEKKIVRHKSMKY